MTTTVWLLSGEARLVVEDYEEVARRLRAAAADPGGLIEANGEDGRPLTLAVAFIVGIQAAGGERSG